MDVSGILSNVYKRRNSISSQFKLHDNANLNLNDKISLKSNNCSVLSTAQTPNERKKDALFVRLKQPRKTVIAEDIAKYKEKELSDLNIEKSYNYLNYKAFYIPNFNKSSKPNILSNLKRKRNIFDSSKALDYFIKIYDSKDSSNIIS